MSDRNSKLARAIRRHHQYRLSRKRRFHWNRDSASPNEDQRSRGMVIDTPTPCSCWMCGNPRRFFGEKTLQELRQDEADGLRKIRKPYFGG